MSATHDMTCGRPATSILRFALPLIGGYLLQQLYTVTDAAILGQWVGVEGLAAVGASWSVIFLIMGFCNGACAGFSIPVAQAFGAHNPTLMRRYVAHAIRCGAWVAGTLTISTVVLCSPILRLVSTPADIFNDAYLFLLLQLLAIPFTMGYNLLAGLIRSVGNSRQPFIILIWTSILNIALDTCFIILFGWGVAGAGLATLLSQAIATLLCLQYLLKKLDILIPIDIEWKPDSHLTRHLLMNGIPMGLQFSITGIGFIMLQRANNALGTTCVAAFTASMRVKYLFTCVFENIGAAMATYCGQNIGAGHIDRVKKGLTAACLISFAYFLATCALIQPFAPQMMHLFVDRTESDIILLGTQLLRINCWFYPVLALLTVLRYSIQGMGYARLAVCSGVMEMFARTGVSLLLVPTWHFLGVCYGDPIAWLAADSFLIPTMLWILHKKSQ